MSSYLLFAVLLGLAGLTSAIKCYLGTPDAQGKVQNTTECPGKFCVIVVKPVKPEKIVKGRNGAIITGLSVFNH
ncbi:hypothetical protein NECAME_15632 [Necator americanus]|uniref:Uncharacterized protein n=1 Tax=Necator americanus TaxID=51031 RepID=W2SGT8_NECAM|nr:hypothetical protein NECAME_15632 [Necator americanus]ETN68800.1 hypothetical protein NECAME_15632 [Necator americanus]